jgi:hypothetical protein
MPLQLLAIMTFGLMAGLAHSVDFHIRATSPIAQCGYARVPTSVLPAVSRTSAGCLADAGAGCCAWGGGATEIAKTLDIRRTSVYRAL